MGQALLANSKAYCECFDSRFQTRAIYISAQVAKLAHIPFMTVFGLTIGKGPNNGPNKMSRHGGEVEGALHQRYAQLLEGLSILIFLSVTCASLLVAT